MYQIVKKMKVPSVLAHERVSVLSPLLWIINHRISVGTVIFLLIFLPFSSSFSLKFKFIFLFEINF